MFIFVLVLISPLSIVLRWGDAWRQIWIHFHFDHAREFNAIDDQDEAI